MARFHQQHFQQCAQDLCQGLLNEAAAHYGSGSLGDDQTVLVLRSILIPLRRLVGAIEGVRRGDADVALLEWRGNTPSPQDHIERVLRRCGNSADSAGRRAFLRFSIA